MLIKHRTSRGFTNVGRPVTVELVGLLPEVYKLCTKCQPLDYLDFVGIHYLDQQLAAYPKPILAEQKMLFDLCERLKRDFADQVRLIPVALMSFRGIWLSLRCSLKNAPFVVIEGRRIIQAQIQYEEIKRIVQAELKNSAGTAGRRISEDNSVATR
jgi:hypothetical protein